jgi:hypothetical protein
MTQLEMATNLMVMDEFICDEMSDGTWETWITYGVPDDDYITVEDYLYLVETEEEYKEFVELFNKLVKGKKKELFLLEYLPKTLDNQG